MFTPRTLRGALVSILLKQEESMPRKRRAKGYILVLNAWNMGKQMTIRDRQLNISNARLRGFKAGNGWTTVLYRIRIYPHKQEERITYGNASDPA